MDKKLVSTKQSAKVALNKSKSLFDLTNNLLDNKYSGHKFQFYLPIESNLTKNQRIAIDCQAPISIFIYDIFAKKMVLNCFIKRQQNLMISNKKCLLVIESELLKFIIKEKLEDNQSVICNLEKTRKKINSETYDEILVYDKYDIETLLYLKERCLSLSFLVFDKEYLNYFPDNQVFTFDEIFLPSYEIFNLARQFTPNNSMFNDSKLLENLKKRNSGADKLICFEVSSFNQEIEIMKDAIDVNPTCNIGIILPYTNDEKNHNLSVEKYYNAISKEYSCSKYYEGIKLKKLHNIVITTYDDAKFIDFDIIILPKFDKVKKIVYNETIFSTICSAENELHIFQETCDKL